MPGVPRGIEGKYHVSRSFLAKFYFDQQSVERDHDVEETAGPYLLLRAICHRFRFVFASTEVSPGTVQRRRSGLYLSNGGHQVMSWR